MASAEHCPCMKANRPVSPCKDCYHFGGVYCQHCRRQSSRQCFGKRSRRLARQIAVNDEQCAIKRLEEET